MPICPHQFSRNLKEPVRFWHAIVVLKTNTKKSKNLSRLVGSFMKPGDSLICSKNRIRRFFTVSENRPPYAGWYPTKEGGALGVVSIHEKVLRLMRKALRVLEILETIFQIKRTSELTLWGFDTLNCVILVPKTSVFFLGWFSQNKAVGVDRL
jgi:hypothetical protein